MIDGYFKQFSLKYLDGFFLPKIIKTWCSENFIYDFVTKIDDKTILSIGCKDNNINNIPSSINNKIQIIRSMIKNFPNEKNLHIRYLPTPFKKTWNSIDKLDTINVNSGLTIYTEKTIVVIVFREEESFKVLIHELIHALELHCVHNGTIINELNNDEMDESIVETWALILNLNRINNKMFSIPQNEEEINHLFKTELFKNEKEFCLLQSAKILREHECNNTGLECSKPIPSQPAIYSYYILKSAFICNPYEFIKDFWIKNMKNCKSVSNDTINKYIYNENFIKEIEKRWNLKSNNTMRMTKYGDFAI